MARYRIVIEIDSDKIPGKIQVISNSFVYQEGWDEVTIKPNTISAWSYELGPGLIEIPVQSVKIERLED